MVAELVNTASERLHISETVYAEIEGNGLLAAALAKDPYATGVAIEPLSETAWIDGKVKLSSWTELSTDSEEASQKRPLAGLVGHYRLVSRANRELALRQLWVLQGPENRGSSQMTARLDQSLEELWTTISDGAGEVLREFPNEVKKRVQHV